MTSRYVPPMSEKTMSGESSAARAFRRFSSILFSHVVLNLAPRRSASWVRTPPAATPSASLWVTIRMVSPLSMWSLRVSTAGLKESKNSLSEVMGYPLIS